MKTFLGITGTTCVGKSQVAVQLAKMLDSEVISADSMQIYKGMDIGTAKITTAEMQGIKHNMLDIVLPNQQFSSFQYQQLAAELINCCKNVPVVAGGTGFYFDSLLYPPEFGNVSDLRRNQLKQILQEQGLAQLLEMLKSLDQEAYETVDRNNPVRVLRAVEIAESGKSRAAGSGKKNARFNCVLYVLQRDRQQLYANIDSRVDKMIADGLVEEVRNLVAQYGVCDTPAFAAIGYKEIVAHLEGKCTLERAVDEIKLNTRHYAKRQITYFKKMNVRKFVDVDGRDIEQVAQEIYEDFCAVMAAN